MELAIDLWGCNPENLSKTADTGYQSPFINCSSPVSYSPQIMSFILIFVLLHKSDNALTKQSFHILHWLFMLLHKSDNALTSLSTSSTDCFNPDSCYKCWICQTSARTLESFNKLFKGNIISRTTPQTTSNSLCACIMSIGVQMLHMYVCVHVCERECVCTHVSVCVYVREKERESSLVQLLRSWATNSRVGGSNPSLGLAVVTLNKSLHPHCSSVPSCKIGTWPRLVPLTVPRTWWGPGWTSGALINNIKSGLRRVDVTTWAG